MNTGHISWNICQFVHRINSIELMDGKLTNQKRKEICKLETLLKEYILIARDIFEK